MNYFTYSLLGMSTGIFVVLIWAGVNCRLPTMRIYRIGETAKRSADLVLANSDWRIAEDDYYTVFKNSRYHVEAWTTTKYFAWWARGKVTDLKSGEVWEWDDELPTRRQVLKLMKHIKKVEPLSLIP